MPEELQQFAVDTCIEALDKEAGMCSLEQPPCPDSAFATLELTECPTSVEKDIASHIKKAFDTKQGATW